MVTLVVDLRGEKDIEQLRHVALALRTQVDLLVKALREAHKNDADALQQALLAIEEASREEAEEPAEDSDEDEEEDDPPPEEEQPKKPKKERTKFGNTAQPNLPEVPLVCTLDEADKVCPCCGGVLHPMKDQFETSEIIDVVDVRYEIKKVMRQKYVCACGGIVETAPGPQRAAPGSRYSLAFAIAIAMSGSAG